MGGENGPVLDHARQIADEVLFADAQRVDRTSIPASNFAALAEEGLFDLAGLEPTEARRVMAAIAGGCGATFFVWVQHHGVVRTVASGSNRELRADLEGPLRSGAVIGGTAFAHVRRADRSAVRAERVDGGWRLSGFAPWATSWGIADRFSVASETADGRLVWSMLPGDGGPGVTATPLALPVFAATGTVALTFDDCMVADADVIAVDDIAAWRAEDRRRSSLGAPAVLGVADRAIRLLASAARSDVDEAHAAADRLARELCERWRADDELLSSLAAGPDDDAIIVCASDHRAACLDIGRRATTALLAAVGGAGMDLSHPAQRLAREAAFYVIQAQTSDGRAATLRSV